MNSAHGSLDQAPDGLLLVEDRVWADKEQVLPTGDRPRSDAAAEQIKLGLAVNMSDLMKMNTNCACSSSKCR